MRKQRRDVVGTMRGQSGMHRCQFSLLLLSLAKGIRAAAIVSNAGSR